MATPAISVQNLTKNYGPVLAVDDISFQVQPGELVGFLGPNGAGKSTCMRILTTWLPASSGYAWLAGYDVMYQSMDVRKRIGYLPESVPLYPEMRVREYLPYRAKLKGVDRAGRTARIDYCLEKCRIKEVQSRLLGTLSKGYRQRVGLADAMLADPPILILDEPTTRPRPGADRRDAQHHPRTRRQAHGAALDAHPDRGREGVRAGHHHRQGQDRARRDDEGHRGARADLRRRGSRPGRDGHEVPPGAAGTGDGGSEAGRRRPDDASRSTPRAARTCARNWPGGSRHAAGASASSTYAQVSLEALFTGVVLRRREQPSAAPAA